MISGESSDLDLLNQAARGSEAAFQTLYHRYTGRVYRFAWEMTGSSAMADEITQDVFFILVRQMSRYDPKRGELGSYLLGIARNQTLQVLRRERLYVEIDESVEASAVYHPPAIDTTTAEGWLHRAILALPPAYREVVLLCDLQELDYAQAAAVLNCPIGTVRSRLHRARALLIEKCQPEKAKVSR